MAYLILQYVQHVRMDCRSAAQLAAASTDHAGIPVAGAIDRRRETLPAEQNNYR